MEKKSTNLDRGELLRRVADESGISKAVLAKRAGYADRSSYYAHILKPDLSDKILLRYGKVLHHDFQEDIQGVPQPITNDPIGGYEKTPVTLEQAIKIIEKLRKDHYNLLVKYEALLEKTGHLQ